MKRSCEEKVTYRKFSSAIQLLLFCALVQCHICPGKKEQEVGQVVVPVSGPSVSQSVSR